MRFSWFSAVLLAPVSASGRRRLYPGTLRSAVQCVVGLFAAVLLGAVAASAQVETGQIAGSVTDPSGAVIPGATITVRNVATNEQRTSTSSAGGLYVVTGLEPATYEVSVTSGNFHPFTARAEVTVGSHVTVDAKLSVSAATTEVQVIAEGGAQVNTQSQELSQVVDTHQMLQLPSLTRNPYDFVALSGNVSAGDNSTNSGPSAISNGSGQNLTNRGAGYAINGQRESGTEILLDGVENVSIFSVTPGQDVPVDSVQEYSVVTNNFSAEYGRASGGVLNVSTKTGTNQFHGSAWEFNRLSAYTANTYANDAANAAAGSIVDPKGKYTRNQFGYTAGGPIIKNKMFIFESTEWTRVRSAATETEEIFDPAFIALMPSNIQSYYSTYGQTTLKSAGVASTVAQVAGATNGPTFGLVNGATPIPASTPMFDTINFTAPFDAGGGIPENTYDLVGRIDYNPTDKTQMFFRGGREASNQFVGSDFYTTYPQYDVGSIYLNQSYLYSLAHTFTPSLFLSAKVSYTRYNDNNSFNNALTFTPNLMFLSDTDPFTGGLIQMPGLENYSEPGEGGVPVGGPQNTVQFEPDLSWTKGRHSFRFGFLGTYIQLDYAYAAYDQAVEQLGATFQDSLNDMMNTADNPNGAPLITFATRANAQGKLPCPIDQTLPPDTTPGFGNVVDNSSCQVTTPLAGANYARSYRYKDWAIYGQDSFKVTPQLTLNYGLRWEHYGVQHNNHPNLDSNFYFGSGSGLEQQVRTGQVEIADQSPVGGFWKPRWGTLAPRVGFAYDLFGNGRTSLRGGYGISYERNFGNVTFNASFNPPASAVISDACGAESSTCIATVTTSDLGPLGQSIGAQYLPPVELRHMDQNIEVAQTQFWSFDVQHQLKPGTVLDIGYSAARGAHLYDLANVNQLGAGQVYLNDPNAIGDLCAGSGVDNLTVEASLTAAGDANASTDASECLTRPNPQYTNVNMRGSAAASNYSALNIGVQSENLHNSGVMLVANYTWAHSLDDLSSTFGDSLQGGSGYVGSLGYTSLADPGLDWGSSDYDIRNRFTLSPIWATPWFKTGNYAARQALGGWTLSGIFTARGGTPFSVFDYGEDVTNYTVPRLEPATPLTSYKVAKSPQAEGPNLFNGLAIPLPKSAVPYNTTLGISDYGPFPIDMMSRNSLRGPGAWNFDAAVEKDFPITERTQLQFRAEGFDVLNHHDYFANTTTLDYGPAPTAPLYVQEEKGGLGSLAESGNHDERRFGQFALKVVF
jgi:hypothetical protein